MAAPAGDVEVTVEKDTVSLCPPPAPSFVALCCKSSNPIL